MQLEIRSLERLPKLSWCATIERGDPIARVRCGPAVEIGPDAFVEGAWDGPFERFGFDRSLLLMGSGGRLTPDGLLLATPSHNFESLSLIRQPDRVTVSNSLAFALESTGLELDPSRAVYAAELQSAQFGLTRACQAIPTLDGPEVRLVPYANLNVNASLDVQMLAKPDVAGWSNFDAYRRFLADGIRQLGANAGSDARRVRYEWLSTMSSGYDSNAAAALAYEAGCRHAISARVGVRVTGQTAPDSGAQIAAALGLEVREAELKPDHLSDAVRAEFAACGDVPELNLFAFESELSGKILTTGNTGGFWDRYSTATSELVRPDTGGSAIAEFRLRVGFIHVPVPTLGAIRHPDINAINNSEAMQPWSVGGFYDRPIPRRILEEKGVPRELFGQTKKGAPIVGTIPEAVRAYYARHQDSDRRFEQAAHLLRWHYSRTLRKVGIVAQRFGLVNKPRELWSLPRPGPLSKAVQWGVEVVRERYRD